MAKIRGTSGPDTLKGTGAGDEINGLGGDDVIYGFGGRDALTGDGGSDTIYGGAGNDHLSGGDGADYLYGEDGDDTIFSGTGADFLLGGAGRDVYEYRYLLWSSNKIDPFTGLPSGVDTILDFEPGIDKFDLRIIDADATTPWVSQKVGNEAFKYVEATDEITPGHLTISVENGNTIIRGYVDTAHGADLEIIVAGVASNGGPLVSPSDIWM